jgi:SAM-dependent methyltransferase
MNSERKKVPQVALPEGFAGRIAFIFMNRGHKSIYENVAKVLELQPEDDLLEVACGNGYFLKKYAKHVHSFAGLDLSHLSVKLATRNNIEFVKAGKAEFIQGDASELPWEGNKFSVVTAMGSFIGFPESLESLREMYRVLRSGGRAIIGIEWNAEDGLDHTKHIMKYGMTMYTEDEIQAMMKKVGFSSISFTYATGFMIPKMMIARVVK